MDSVRQIVTAGISRFREDYRDSSRRMRIILVASVTGALVVVGATVFRSCLSSLDLLGRWRGVPALVLTDEKGDRWVLDPLKGQPLSKFKNRGDKLGPPLLVKTDSWIENGEVSIGLIVQGQAGEKYVGGARKNGKWQPPPRLSIVDEAGSVLESGMFRYG